METSVSAGGTLELVIDETLERRWGPKISKRGHYRDSALSSRKRSVSSPGLRWMVMAVVVTLPWTKHRWALPDLGVLATTPEVSASLGKRHKSVGMWTRHMVKLLRRWLLTLPITLLGDTAYSILELGLECQEQQVSLLTPFHLDAALYELPPERDAHPIGRPRVVGSRLPSLEQVLADPNTTWQRLSLDWYGQGERTLEICSGSAWWYRAGFPPLPIGWVLTRDPQGKRPPKALVSTNQGLTAEHIVRTFMHRWCLETTFEESRAHLGIEHNASGLIWPLTARHPCFLASTAWLHSLGGRFIPRDVSPSRTRPGITNTRRPFMMSWQRSDDRLTRAVCY